ncbi:MAG: DNA alkylation repair protein [Candidatus Thiodiazotropha weberae]|uniref:DNA alkylation repair protein n=1 Tax=Candidatus Thiodiazotropha endoloripes TaxID=1818881 RepID=A0A1E2USE3_9GAMM|nr:DNA alkylation repair protein [Candidatus Thiodiazotropha endoloripes]MCG7898044.1 DNA alkylation repair protein [Candidatus Thiodiazotropha weberae]MCG7901606.1 DNA alkylation repair protein [Candidatus Thiodiazotropha weberae]MCG7913840.1 DNA alkylation repair protein [Candidatus Thiodiazotropha weberae]ODB86544.1 DNA alkylation repair protein [Candidatus Thiodiazotropha endoloripes]ODB88575.1 DNA alkylation repair protein [Candidatus Thiodiazotropha endoloripes]
MKAEQLTQKLESLANPEIAAKSQRFFKTGKGDYGEGDRFLGIRVPILRQQARGFQQMSLTQVLRCLKSAYHEERLCALLILVRKFESGDETLRERVFRHYLDNTRYINNWDLVDSSAYQIVGAYLLTRERAILYELARSDSLWERRIAMIATYRFIKNQQYDDALAIAELLMLDQQDLIHKAVGWMIREVGNRDRNRAQQFLKPTYQAMPRTMLRYAIEKFPEPLRQIYLKGEI